jgi:hypothetical protein
MYGVFMRIFKIVLLSAAALLPSASLARAQGQQSQDPKCQPWIGIKSWDVHAHVNGSGTSANRGGYTISYQESDDIDFQLTLDPFTAAAGAPCQGNWDWTNVQQSQSNVHASVSYSSGACQFNLSTSSVNGPVAGSQAAGGILAMDFEKGTYFASAVAVPVAGPWDSQSSNGLCLNFETLQDSGGYIFSSTGPAEGPSCPGYDPTQPAPIVGGLPGSGGLSGSVSYTCPSVALSSPGFGDGLDLFSWTITWSMTPTPANLKLVVAIPLYETWRPTAGQSEKDIGINSETNFPNTVEMRAQLMDKDTGIPSYLVPDKVVFILANVSREPGVAMNWPPQGSTTTDPDLSFDCELNFAPEAGVKVDSNECLKNLMATGTQIEFDPQDNEPVSANVSPHDWGGWATVNVTATVAGVDYQGSLDSDPGNTDILVPKRQPGSRIADSWKNGKVSLDTPDSDDSEDNPKGDGQPGDGFTLYEEYRGFYMGCSSHPGAVPLPEDSGTARAFCQHVEGDPKTKDLFVEEETTADPGILQLQVDTGLKIHFKGLTQKEFGPKGNDYRVMNLNYSEPPHEVDQHAIVIQLGPSTGASRGINIDSINCPAPVVPHACRPGLPGEIDHVEMAYKTTEGLDATNGRWVSDIAHELAHAIDVYHHGDVDHDVFWQVDPNTGGIVERDTRSGPPRPITVTTEDTNFPILLSTLDLDKGSQRVFVGNAICGGQVILHGQHSGDEQSLMRYDVAQAYIPAGAPNARFWVAGTETTGFDLTDHPGGTGVNDPDRLPLPRYGDAFTGRGEDLSSIDVNDHNSARIKADQPCP